ncbi:hypothetical protein OS493_023811 [Desmophyllum pertusum]|uniref:Uncharacterized protein n=1 Tax=Desmophyllum pertusum TaxID=174260 RepID=A0A9X0CLL3_9CNID|nr:hypothetical protein OS493_023811 [Desmophyllum pertusum]
MFAVPSTLQLLLAIVLVLFGVCGNLVIPFVSYRTSLRCPHIKVLAALDFTATLLGPGLMLVTIVTGPTWLEHNKTLCQSLSFLSSWVQITCFLVLFFLAVFCQNVQHKVHPGETRHAKRRELVFLALCLLAGLLLSVLPLLGWSSYNGLHLLSHTQIFSNHSIFYLMCSFVVLSITTFLAVRETRRRRLYPVQLFWDRHILETKINDPEMTTFASVNSKSKSTSKSYTPRRSSAMSGRRSSVISCNSPMAVRKVSQRTRASLERTVNVLLEIISRERALDTQPGSGTGPRAEPEVPSVASGISEHGIPGGPFVISSRVPPIYPMLTRKKNVFENPRCLPPFKGFQQQRSLSRLLLLRCCVTVLCWLPLYVLLALQISSVDYPHQVHIIITWLIVTQSSISSLLPLCDASYRLVCRRAAYSCFKTCAVENNTHADLSKSRDVEFRIEGSQQVQLRDVIPLEGQKFR